MASHRMQRLSCVPLAPLLRLSKCELDEKGTVGDGFVGFFSRAAGFLCASKSSFEICPTLPGCGHRVVWRDGVLAPRSEPITSGALKRRSKGYFKLLLLPTNNPFFTSPSATHSLLQFYATPKKRSRWLLKREQHRRSSVPSASAWYQITPPCTRSRPRWHHFLFSFLQAPHSQGSNTGHGRG